MQRIVLPALLISLVLLSACSSHQPLTSHRINEMDMGMPGTVYYYALPRTAVVVELEVKETTKTPGPYAGYARSHLGINDVIHDPSTTYSIQRVEISTFSEPDPKQLFFVRPPENKEDQKFFLALNEAGIIRAFNKTPEQVQQHGIDAMSKDYGRFGTEVTFPYLMDSILKERIDTIIETVPLDTVTVQRQTLRRSWVEKSTELRAQEVADYILDLRDKKLDLISGFQEIPYSSEALKYMYGEMDRIENDYLDLFTGITTTQTLRYRFVHRPEKEDIVRRHTLFRFSARQGILAKDADAGFPVTVSYDRSKATDPLQFAITARLDDPRRRPQQGMHYRIPEYADVLLHVGTEKRAEARLLVNQFGIVSHLPAHDMGIEFHPATGSIRSIGNRKKDNE